MARIAGAASLAAGISASANSASLRTSGSLSSSSLAATIFAAEPASRGRQSSAARRTPGEAWAKPMSSDFVQGPFALANAPRPCIVAKRMERGGPFCVGRHDLGQLGQHVGLAALDEQPLRREPPEEIVVAQRRDQRSRLFRIELGIRGRLGIVGHDPPDAAVRFVAERSDIGGPAPVLKPCGVGLC